jgi:4'-phosphopantetheinyl transferase
MLIKNIKWECLSKITHINLSPKNSEIVCLKINLNHFTASDIDLLTKFLGADELDRLRRLRNTSDQRLFIASHGALNSLVTKLTGSPKALGYHPHGKPFLINSDLEFNISHSGEIAIIALSNKTPVGIDVEKLLPLEDRDALLRQFFHAKEEQEIISLSEQESQLAFYNCWTRKEAILKATGEGLSTDSKSFYAGSYFSHEDSQLQLPPNYPVTWNLWDFVPEPGYMASIAMPANESRLTFYSIPPIYLCS